MYIKKYLQKRIYISIITVMVLVITIISSSYAIFMDVKTDTLDQVLTVGDLQITYTGGSAINLNGITPETDVQAYANPNDVYTFTIDNTGQVPYKYTIYLENNPSYPNNLLNHNYIRYDLNNSGKNILGTKTEGILLEGTLKPGEAKLYNLRIWVGIEGLPNEAIGKEVHLNIMVDGKAGESDIVLGANHIIALASDSASTGVYNEPATDYRYEGLNPNNYVTFNNELWRIIGVFSDNTHGKAGESLIKIIRNESIGNMKWDDSNVNNWETSTLKTYLNGTYLNSIESSSKDLIENVTWKLGGYADTSTTTAQAYEAERGTTVYSGRPTSGTGHIGLMYPSDYGYSTTKSECRSKDLYNFETINCQQEAWIFNSSSSQWTLTPTSSLTTYVWDVNRSANVIYASALLAYAARPVLYLKSNTVILSGDGSLGTPYILGR